MAVSARMPQAAPAARRSPGARSPAPVDLDEDQHRIVEHLAGGLLVLAPDEAGELEEIARRVRALAVEGNRFAYRRVAVLARTNARCAEIAAAFRRVGIPHVTAELAHFFRQPEVKDALAYLRLVAHPEDTGAALRVREQGTRGLDDGTLGRGRRDGERIGLRLVDLFRAETFALGDPLGRVVDAFARGALVVFDVETTGLDPRRDEIVEIAATRLERGSAVERFHALLRPPVRVGEPARTHGLSNIRLAAEGRAPAAALARGLDHLEERHDCVPIVTIHHSKGLQFDTVFVSGSGFAQGVVPARFATERGGEEEERRLFYVALTRARRRLFLSLSERTPWGGRRRPSPFLGPLAPWLARGA